MHFFCPVCFYVSHMVFDTVKEDGVNMPELLQSLVPFNLLIFIFYEELLDE